MGALFTGFALDATGYIPDAVQSMSTINGMRIIMIGLPIIFVIISFIVYKKYYKLNSEYMTRIMNILSLKKEENKVEENNQNKELKEVNYANSIS